MIYLKLTNVYDVRMGGVEVPFFHVYPIDPAPFVGKTFLSLLVVLEALSKINRQCMYGPISGFCLFPLIYMSICMLAPHTRVSETLQLYSKT